MKKISIVVGIGAAIFVMRDQIREVTDQMVLRKLERLMKENTIKIRVDVPDEII